MNFCIDCQHIRCYGFDYPDWRCLAYQNMGPPTLVTGLPKFRFKTAEFCREAIEGGCGLEGKWFVQKIYTQTETIKIGGFEAVEFNPEELNRVRELAKQKLSDAKQRKVSKKIEDDFIP